MLIEEAVRYNKNHAIPMEYISTAPVDSEEFARAVHDFQHHFGLTVDGKLGPSTLAEARQQVLETDPPQPYSDYRKVARLISQFEGKFWSCNRDGEYRGLFDRGDKKHWASGKIHIGLSYGFIQFTQDSGSLGKLLVRMRAAHPGRFRKIFGEHSRELLEVTNRTGRNRVSGRSPRVQPVGGHDLWDAYWVEKFQRAGKVPAFQDAQLDMAIEGYMKPAIKTCKELGLVSERSLALVFDRSVHYGPRGAKNLIKGAGGPDEEHLLLRHLLNEWKGRRWHHRVQKIYMNPTLMDSTCVFE